MAAGEFDVEYELGDWPFDRIARLRHRLDSERIAHYWDDTMLVVPPEFEDAVDMIVLDFDGEWPEYVDDNNSVARQPSVTGVDDARDVNEEDEHDWGVDENEDDWGVDENRGGTVWRRILMVAGAVFLGLIALGVVGALVGSDEDEPDVAYTVVSAVDACEQWWSLVNRAVSERMPDHVAQPHFEALAKATYDVDRKSVV